jgi:hypothetical protein
MGVEPDVIKANNRWRKVEKAQGKKVSSSMCAHYTNVRLIIDYLLIFSLNLYGTESSCSITLPRRI